MSKTSFNQIYIKKEYAGFVGVKAMVRTPSRSEVMASLISNILHIMAGVLNEESSLTEGGIAFFRGLPSKPWDVQFAELANNLYFVPCMIGCGDPECREWVDVYGLGGEVFCHVSECQLIPLEEAQEIIDEPVGEVSLPDFIKSKMDAISSQIHQSGVMSPEPVCNMPDEIQGIYFRGYAAALADMLSTLSGGDVLKDV